MVYGNTRGVRCRVVRSVVCDSHFPDGVALTWTLCRMLVSFRR
jgi:hypothetical protein